MTATAALTLRLTGRKLGPATTSKECRAMLARSPFVTCILAPAGAVVLAAPAAAQAPESGDTLLGLDFDLYRSRVEPIFLNRRPGNARRLGGPAPRGLYRFRVTDVTRPAW